MAEGTDETTQVVSDVQDTFVELQPAPNLLGQSAHSLRGKTKIRKRLTQVSRENIADFEVNDNIKEKEIFDRNLVLLTSNQSKEDFFMQLAHQRNRILSLDLK